ncbi:MAG: hypothetical protein JRH11_14075 [Deltaproteobacteria bacterium]|nr:hypothetical protein [Deltaproteobacteria bacterium]
MNNDDTRDDLRLTRAFSALGPSARELERMRGVILAAYAALPPLTEEWLTMLRARPVANAIYTFAAAAVLVLGALLSAVPWTALSEL